MFSPGVYLPHLPTPVPWTMTMLTDPLSVVCTECGRPMREHYIGGPHKSCPVDRPALWFWQ